LRSAGLLVGPVASEQQRARELGRQGPALALLLLLVCAVAAALLAVGATAVSLLASGRRRAFEIGAPTGYLVAWLVMPALATFSDPTPVPVRYVPSVVPVLWFALAFGALLWATAVVAGRLVARAAVPSRLREADR
jgi:putative ABC transport system permease protein